MDLLLLPCRAASARPLLPPTSPSALRRARTARPAASSSNVEVVDATATSTPGSRWRAGGLGLELSEEMRRGMLWRMVAPPAAAVAADAAFLRLLDRAAPGDAPAWAAAAGSALLFVAGLLGVHYGFLSSSPSGSNATDDGEGERGNIRNKEDLGALLGKVLDAYRSSNNDLRTFLQNLVDAGVVDESEVFGGADDDDLLRALIDADLPGGDPDLSVLWKLPVVAALSFAGVPALLGYLGDAAGACVPAWMPLVYSLASFLLGSLLVVDASVTGLDLQPPIWVAFLLFGVLLGVPYGVFSASFDPAVEGSWLGWEEFVKNIRHVVLQAGAGHNRSNKK
ncbi:hypothetical protein C2845_PM11G24280 [Panicum miliaceum]|uniref:Uncharacterized protein n=1 Tax=Panicum miliaceum TaxID=4540 RepID=A0A3L6RQT2_PANMI|nr:hypothetical protein C2845_PM11G24280 [Panicum miliaceum]